jgi:hypothetical protein
MHTTHNAELRQKLFTPTDQLCLEEAERRSSGRHVEDNCVSVMMRVWRRGAGNDNDKFSRTSLQ